MAKLISLEGTDLAGKTSIIIPYLHSKLGEEKYHYVADMKTGLISQKIREIFMSPDCVTENTDWRTIAYLVSAARSDMVYQHIIPALKANKSVICDRYVDTSFVYNKDSHKQPVDTILNLSTHLVYPHTIIFAYCSYDEMVTRKSLRDGDENDQWDIVGEDEYNSKIERYREQFKTRSCNVIEIDTSGTLEETYAKLDLIILDLIIQQLV